MDTRSTAAKNFSAAVKEMLVKQLELQTSLITTLRRFCARKLSLESRKEVGKLLKSTTRAGTRVSESPASSAFNI